VLTRLLRSTGKRRLRLLAAYRSTEVLPGHLLSTLMVDLAREDLVSQLELAPLQPKDAVALVNSVLEGEGLLPPAHAPEGTESDQSSTLAARVVASAGGVPFFLVNCARWLQARAEHEELGEEQGDASARHERGKKSERAAHQGRNEQEGPPYAFSQPL